MGSPEHEDFYKEVVVRLGFRRFTSVGTERVGKPIFYAMTIPKNAPHPKLAAEFVEFMVSEEGLCVLRDMEQPTVSPVADNPDKMHEGLKRRALTIRTFVPPITRHHDTVFFVQWAVPVGGFGGIVDTYRDGSDVLMIGTIMEHIEKYLSTITTPFEHYDVPEITDIRNWCHASL